MTSIHNFTRIHYITSQKTTILQSRFDTERVYFLSKTWMKVALVTFRCREKAILDKVKPLY